MAKQRSLTEQLADALCCLRPVDFPESTLATASAFVMDWLACAVAGTASKPGRILIAEGESRGDGPCSVLGLSAGRDAEVAALVNGGLSHIVEMDDLDRQSVVHPGCVVIPAALAVAEEARATGREFLAAVIVGYEVAIRIGSAVGRSHYAYWQNTATCGGFGSAAAAGFLLALSPEQHVWALGSAGSMAAGLWQFNRDGAMTKHLHAGRAAANGVIAARLAHRGFTGAREILEGEQGFFAAMSSDAEPERVVAGLDQTVTNADWAINRVSVKPHASCRHTHPAVDAALALRSEIDLASVRDISVETYGTALNLTDAPDPVNRFQAKFSLQYTVARALVSGRVGLRDFDTTMLSEPGVRDVMARIRLVLDPELDQRYPAAWAAAVNVELADGTVRRVIVDAPKGDPENPLSADDLRAKFTDMVAWTEYGSETERLLTALDSLMARRSMSSFLPASVDTPHD
jgi:2-methylcitrate dehydratase PrpD